jgi:hypothetical protein
MTVYEVLEEYVHAQKAAIDQGEAVVIEVRDTDTFERLVVRAEVGPPERPLEEANPLILRDLAENISADDWTIKVIEELDPESVDIKPESNFRKHVPDG